MPIDSVPGRPQSPRRPKGVNRREPDRPAPISLPSPRAAPRPLPSYSLPPHLQKNPRLGGIADISGGSVDGAALPDWAATQAAKLYAAENVHVLNRTPVVCTCAWKATPTIT